jgi:hypothetical protein
VAARIPGGPKIEPTASDGYWMHLLPLEKGRLRYASAARCRRYNKS